MEKRIREAPPPPAPGEELIQAKVKPGNRYGGKAAGTLVEVTASELRRVSHALISLEEEARLAEEAAKPKPPTAGQLMFRGFRKSAMLAQKAQDESRGRQMRNQLETLGIKVG